MFKFKQRLGDDILQWLSQNWILLVVLAVNELKEDDIGCFL